MRRRSLALYLLPVTLLACQAQSERGTDTLAVTDSPAGAAATATPEAPAGSPEAKIADAMRAAPEEIARNATIMDWPATPGGEPKELRAGSNGWVCFPTSPAATGAAGEDPMCLDKGFQAWGEAWMSKKAPPKLQGIAMAYMLRGDAGASNTDPYATKQTPDNEWVQSGPHVMILVPNTAQLAPLPTDPNTGGPFVMWKGTPYAHVMVPVSSSTP